MGAISKTLGAIYLLIGLYLANASFDFVSLPIAGAIEGLIFLIAAVLVIIAGVKNLMKGD